MKRKSVFITLLCLTLAVVLCLGLVSCGPSATAASGVKGEKITEAQWVKALKDVTGDNSIYENFKVECVDEDVTTYVAGQITTTTVTTIYKVGNEYYSEIVTSHKGDAMLLAGRGLTSSTAAYYYKVDTTKSYGFEYTGKWNKNEGKANTNTISTLRRFLPITNSNEDVLKEAFAGYEYNDDYKGYVLKDSVAKGEVGGLKCEQATVYKFDGEGRLSAYWYIDSTRSDVGGLSKSSRSATITYGGQQLPGKPTDEEISKAYPN